MPTDTLAAAKKEVEKKGFLDIDIGTTPDC